MTRTREPPTADAATLRPLLTVRIRTAPDVTYDERTGVLWVPRRNPLERLLARLIHRGESRVRVALDDRSREVMAMLRAGSDVAVPDLAKRLGIALPQPSTPPAEWDPKAVALLLFLAALARSRALLTKPI